MEAPPLADVNFPNFPGKMAMRRFTMNARNQIRFDGLTPEDILDMPGDEFDGLIANGEPISFRAGPAEILAQISQTEDAIRIDLVHIEGGGEGVLPALTSLAIRFARKRRLKEIEWRVDAVSCVRPNLKLRRVLERRGFEITSVLGIGLVYFLVQPVELANIWPSGESTGSEAPAHLDFRALVRAAIVGDCDEISYLLSLGLHADASGSNQITALMMAAREGKHNAVRLLLHNGADASLCSKERLCPLNYATDREIVTLLLSKGGTYAQVMPIAYLKRKIDPSTLDLEYLRSRQSMAGLLDLFLNPLPDHEVWYFESELEPLSGGGGYALVYKEVPVRQSGWYDPS